jgi:mono/diheme cytochrome c family protein
MTTMRGGSWPALLIVGTALVAADAAPLVAQSRDRDAWVAPARRAQRANPLEATPQIIAQGRELYMLECASCHGATGNNDGDQAPSDLADTRKPADPSLHNESDGSLFWKIGEGRGSMPSTWDVLSDPERWAIVLYLRTLAPEPGEATPSSGR